MMKTCIFMNYFSRRLSAMDRIALVLVLTLTASMFRGDSVKATGTTSTVRGWRGENIRLRCDIQEEPKAVYWIKESISDQQVRTIKAAFFDGDFESREERFDIEKTFSLVITDLEVADEGLYYCQVLLNNLEVFENSTFMRIDSMASKHAIEGCVDNSQFHQSRCRFQTPSETPSFNLTCVVSGFKPNISLLWKKESGESMKSVVSKQKTLSDNTYERFETITVSAKHETEQTFMCIATGDSLNGTSTTGVTVLSTPGKRGNMSLVVGLVVGVPVVIVFIFLLLGKFLQNYYPDYLPRKGCGWNPFWRRPRRPERVDEEEEFLLRPALTREQVQQCKEELRAYYRVSQRKVSVDPLNFMERVNLDDIYTNLSLIDHSDKRKITPLMYEDLLTSDGSLNLSKRLLIQGEGGVGKTTLCAKIAWDWCQERILHDLDMVIVIPLRDVTNENSIGHILRRYFSDSNTATPKNIDHYISTNPSKVLLVFDGFDEFNGKLDKKSTSEVIRIIRIDKYKSSKVIVTTMPWRTDEFRMDKSLGEMYTFVSVEGFNKESVSNYIRRYFRIREKDTLAENLIGFIEENDVIRSNMAPFPIYCAMLCLMWNSVSKERRKRMQKLRTFFHVFREMISFLKEHCASKFWDNLHNQKAAEYVKEADRAIQDISEIALTGLLQRNLSFPEAQFRKCRKAMETCCRVGVLTKETHFINRDHWRDVNIATSFVESTVSFPHKLFQEYIAGIFIEHLFAKDRAKYNKLKSKCLNKYEEFRYLLYFASALRNELGLDIINDLKRRTDDQYFCVDVAFECHTEEAARAVGEQWEEYKLLSHTSEHTQSGVVFMVLCNQVRTLSINGVNCGRIASRDLAESLCSSSSVLRKVAITDSQFYMDFYNIVGAKAPNCQIQELELFLGNESQHDSSIREDLGRWVRAMPSLSRLIINCKCFSNIIPSKATSLAPSSQIQYLNLIFCENSQHHSSMGEALVEWVCDMPKLLSFSMECSSFPDKFLSTATVKARSLQIQDLTLTIDTLDTDSDYPQSLGENLAQWVCSIPSLLSFSLTCHYMPDGFFSTAASSSSSSQITKFSLEIYDLGMSEQAAAGEKLAEFLCSLHHLERADLKYRGLPKTFFATISSQAARKKLDGITVNGEALNQLLGQSGRGDSETYLRQQPKI